MEGWVKEHFEIRCTDGSMNITALKVEVNGQELNLPSLDGELTTTYKSAGYCSSQQRSTLMTRVAKSLVFFANVVANI